MTWPIAPAVGGWSLDSVPFAENAFAAAPFIMLENQVTKTIDKPAESFRVAEKNLSARGLRSREKLKQAAVTCINRSGFRDMRVQDITVEAGVANGLFYRYFEDLNEIAVEIASDLFAQLIGLVDQVDIALPPFEWMTQVHEATIGAFSDNPGILGCLFGKSNDENSFSQVWDANAHDWNLRVADRLVAWQVATPSEAQSLCFTLGAVTEGLLYQALVRRTPDLIGVTGGTTAGLARLTATMWHRIIFLNGPAGSPDWLAQVASKADQ